jgi:putative FmdB family regulatory protein
VPLYEYLCPTCGRFEVIRKFSDEPLTKCPTCGAEIQKLMSAPAIQFKGTGWYITDYARKDGKSGTGASGEVKTGDKGGESKGGESKGGESKGGESKGGESKSAESRPADSGSSSKKKDAASKPSKD